MNQYCVVLLNSISLLCCLISVESIRYLFSFCFLCNISYHLSQLRFSGSFRFFSLNTDHVFVELFQFWVFGVFDFNFIFFQFDSTFMQKKLSHSYSLVLAKILFSYFSSYQNFISLRQKFQKYL